MTRFDQVWPVLTRYGQIWSDMIRYDQLWPDITRFDQIWTRYDQIWPDMDQIWSDLIRFNLIYITIFYQIWQDMTRYDQIWPDMIRTLLPGCFSPLGNWTVPRTRWDINHLVVFLVDSTRRLGLESQVNKSSQRVKSASQASICSFSPHPRAPGATSSISNTKTNCLLIWLDMLTWRE